MSMSTEALLEVLRACDFTVTDSTSIPERPARFGGVPPRLHPRARKLLAAQYPEIYSHQAKALEAILNGKNVCLATSTASGKSLVFMTAAANLSLMNNGRCKVLALYPAKALIADQLKRWSNFLAPLELTVGQITGDVSSGNREGILQASDVVLMTPDVAHAWAMSNLSNPVVLNFMESLRLLVLDESHVYEGVFGSNMAYFLRRLAAISPDHTIISTTATIGDANPFMNQLTGREFVCIDLAEDGAYVPPKTIICARESVNDGFDARVRLLLSLAKLNDARFIAFADSRKAVELYVSALSRDRFRSIEEEDLETRELKLDPAVLPYRAGYEDQDRIQIQQALESGKLRGVVSTSALELGLDIGELSVVVMLDVPHSMKAFWQRMGRAGRRLAGYCLMLDSNDVVSQMHGGLSKFLQRPIEPNWLYLENIFIQYTNALCATRELATGGSVALNRIQALGLPEQFYDLLLNELNPTRPLPADLMPLRQRAEGGAHFEFSLRGGVDKSLKVWNGHLPMGSVTYSQALREAYPGAIYYYMGLPYRVQNFNFGHGKIIVSRERRWTTRPTTQVMVFPNFGSGAYQYFKSESGFFIESEIQVSEKVSGFTEKRGSNSISNEYGPNSPYSARPLNRFFPTTGVCWYFKNEHTYSAKVASAIYEAFCVLLSIQPQDIGVGTFHTNSSPVDRKSVRGMCIYDATNGSLRLTQQLVARFSETIDFAKKALENDAETSRHMDELVAELARLKSMQDSDADLSQEDEWMTIVAPGEQAMFIGDDGTISVTVLSHLYTPQGLKYQLVPLTQGTSWQVTANRVQPIHGQTMLHRLNLNTGEVEAL